MYYPRLHKSQKGRHISKCWCVLALVSRLLHGKDRLRPAPTRWQTKTEENCPAKGKDQGKLASVCYLLWIHCHWLLPPVHTHCFALLH